METENKGTKITVEVDGVKSQYESKDSNIDIDYLFSIFGGLLITQTWMPTTIQEGINQLAKGGEFDKGNKIKCGQDNSVVYVLTTSYKDGNKEVNGIFRSFSKVSEMRHKIIDGFKSNNIVDVTVEIKEYILM